MGPYPSRFTRAPGVMANRGTAFVPASASTCAPPPLKALYSIRAYAAATTQALSVPSLPVLATDLVRLIALPPGRSATLQLTALPTTFLSHMALWQLMRMCCASTTATAAAVAVHPGGQWGRRRTSLRWGRLANTTVGPAVSPLREFSVTANATDESALTRISATAPAAASSSAASVQGVGPLHTAKRHYRSAAAHAPTGGDDRRCSDEAGALSRPPTFAEIYAAFQTLRLVDTDGRSVRAWTTADIKRAYRSMAKELHPDVAGGDSAGMEHVNAAYACLTTLGSECADRYRSWLEGGGEAELLAQDTQAVPSLLCWGSRDVMQLMLVGGCTTVFGLAAYAGWRFFRQSAGASEAASLPRSSASVSGFVADIAVAGSRLTLPRAGVTLSTAPGVQYGVVSSGASVFVSARLPLRGIELVRVAVSRYALAVALTVAACVNTLMIQRVLAHLITGAV